ncbi:MAG: glycosyltransferase family 2 protein [PVC group bacterium]|nr:glycosyltransferase family 2 protein [PVC group bacterium]
MIKLIFWINLCLVIAVYAGYPITISLLAFLFKKPHQKDESYTPKVTMLIPAYNEEPVIAEKLENTLRLDYPKDSLEVIVMIDESSDKTESIVAGYQDKGIKMWVQRPRQGKMAALNASVPQAEGDIVLFSDANSMYRPDAVRKIVRHFGDPKIGLVCGELRLIDPNSLVGLGESFYWRYERFLKQKESMLQQVLVVNGSIYAIRKELFSPIDPALADDFIIPMRIAAGGYGLIYEPDAINEEKVSDTTEDQFNRKVRIIAQGVRAAFSMLGTVMSTSVLRVFEFLFHKFLRWFVFMFTCMLFAANMFILQESFYRAFLLLQIIFYLLALIGYILQKKNKHIKLFFIPFYFFLVNFASFCGVLSFLFGKKKATWEKAESTR